MQLTVELLQESLVGYHKSSPALKTLTLEYIAPWLANLALINRRSLDDQAIQKKTRDILRSLTELTVKEPDVFDFILLFAYALDVFYHSEQSLVLRWTIRRCCQLGVRCIRAILCRTRHGI